MVSSSTGLASERYKAGVPRSPRITHRLLTPPPPVASALPCPVRPSRSRMTNAVSPTQSSPTGSRSPSHTCRAGRTGHSAGAQHRPLPWDSKWTRSRPSLSTRFLAPRGGRAAGRGRPGAGGPEPYSAPGVDSPRPRSADSDEDGSGGFSPAAGTPFLPPFVGDWAPYSTYATGNVLIPRLYLDVVHDWPRHLGPLVTKRHPS